MIGFCALGYAVVSVLLSHFLMALLSQARLDSEEYYARMCDEAVSKMQAEINKECNERELSEQHFFGLLEETTARVRAKM